MASISVNYVVISYLLGHLARQKLLDQVEPKIAAMEFIELLLYMYIQEKGNA